MRLSVQAMSWVIEKSTQKGSNLLVLLMIANHADTAGKHAYPGLRTLAAETRLTERGVRYILPKLEGSGELVIERDAGPFGTHLYSLPGVVRDGFNLRGLPENFAGRNPKASRVASGNLPANGSNSSGKSFAPEPKRTETKTKNLRTLSRPNSPSCGNSAKAGAATPQQRRFAIVERLTTVACEILDQNPSYSLGDLAEDLKNWAARNNVPYFDAWPGAATPISQAITNAFERRRKTA